MEKEYKKHKDFFDILGNKVETTADRKKHFEEYLNRLAGQNRIINLMKEYPLNPSTFPDNLRKIDKEYDAGMGKEIKLYELSISHRHLSKVTNPVLDYLIKKDMIEIKDKIPQMIKYHEKKLEEIEEKKKRSKGEEKINLIGFDINFLAFLMSLFIIAFVMGLI